MIETGTSQTIPAPVGGWNTRDPLDGMDVFFALRMDNWFPEERSVSFRKGFSQFATGMGAEPVASLMVLREADSTETMIAASDGKLWDVTTGTPSSLGSGFTVDAWQHVCMNNVLVMVNGSDQPQQWNGTALSAATYTGLTDNDLIQATVYRSRIYFTAKDSASIWYGGIRSITGALTEFPVGYEFQLGGYPMWVSTWTRGAGDVTQDLLVICSSQGEVLLYAGSSPDLEGFGLVGRAFLGKPLGRRSYLNVGTELEIITDSGVVPLSQVMSNPLYATANTLTDKIAPTFNSSAALYGTNSGWEGVVYRKGRYVAYNIPVDSAQSHQYVRNLYTGAWSRFTGQNAACWCVFGDNLYFGGMAGDVYKADDTLTDNGANIETHLKFSFNYLGNRESLKKVSLVRPLLVSSSQISFQLGADVDFENKDLTDTITTQPDEGGEWDVADWDSAEWAGENINVANWYSITGLGRCVSLKFRADVSGVASSMTAAHVIYQEGGLI